jgi:hypothetical protein
MSYRLLLDNLLLFIAIVLLLSAYIFRISPRRFRHIPLSFKAVYNHGLFLSLERFTIGLVGVVPRNIFQLLKNRIYFAEFERYFCTAPTKNLLYIREPLY